MQPMIHLKNTSKYYIICIFPLLYMSSMYMTDPLVFLSLSLLLSNKKMV